MNRSINPIVYSAIEYFRHKGRLVSGESRPLTPGASAEVSANINETFTRFTRDDNGPNDLDLRYGYVTKQGPTSITTVVREGNLQAGSLERQTLIPIPEAAKPTSLPIADWPSQSFSSPSQTDGFDVRKEAGAQIQETELILADGKGLDQLQVLWGNHMASFTAFHLDKLDIRKNSVTTWNIQEVVDPCMSSDWQNQQQFLIGPAAGN